jgi:hypothetical protein
MRVFGGHLGLALALSVGVLLSAVVVVSLGGLVQAGASSPAAGHTYNATFNETGLPGGTEWGVHVSYLGCGCDGGPRTVTSDLPSLTIPVTNGSYRYNVLSVPGYFVNVSATGKFNVSGANVPTINVVFHAVVTYATEFTETGLPPGTPWTVAVTGNGAGQERALEDVAHSSTGTSMNFSLPNGTYHFTVAKVPGSYFVHGSSHGMFVVAGAAPATISVTFVTPAAYAVTFSETGLPLGTNWSVRLDGWGGVPVHEAQSSTTANISFSLPNGTYRYVVAEVLGFVVRPSLGTVMVTDAPARVNVSFTAVAPGAFYPVAFEELGLASGAHWVVTVTASHTFGHSRQATQSSNGVTIFFLLQNGTYRYSVHSLRGWIAEPMAGSFSIVGSAPGAIVVNFTQIPVYRLTVNETGLANGTSWSVLVRSESAGSTVWPVRLTESSTTATIVFSLPNGTYCYRIYPVTGYTLPAGASAGSFTVAGASPTGISVVFSPKG